MKVLTVNWSLLLFLKTVVLFFILIPFLWNGGDGSHYWSSYEICLNGSVLG